MTDGKSGQIGDNGKLQSLRLAHAGLAAMALLLAACTASPPPVAPQAAVAAPRETRGKAEMSPAVLREHQRILAAYGGVYNDPRLQSMIEQTVERLVAASERPDLHYKVTMLNSQSINAFALPTGQLYVTRGLIALANDESELASVLAHEMGHVIARHAAIREEQARQAALVSRVVTRCHQRSGRGRACARQVEACARQLLARAGVRGGRDRRRHRFARRLRPLRRGAVPHFDGAQFRTQAARPASAIDPRAPDFLSSHPATPERITNALANARQYGGAGRSAVVFGRDKDAYLSGINGIVFGEDPSEGFVRGRRFLHPRLGFTFTAPEGFALDNTAQAVLGVKHGGGQALRLDVVRVPSEQTLAAYLTSGWIENIDSGTVEDITINGFPGATAAAKGDQWDFRLYAIRFGSDVYRFIFASQAPHARDRPRVPRVDRHVPPHEPRRDRGAKPLRLKIVTVGPGDTVEKLASRMAVADRHVERFRVLNGLEAGDRLKSGSEVKIVVE